MNAPFKFTADFPAILKPMFEPHRFKVLYGGRLGGKSWAVARWLLIEGRHQRMRILCCREIQRSIDESVHQLLRDQIRLLGLESFYRVTNNRIYGANGTVFMFAGLWQNVDSIKSKEGLSRVWVEEAHKVSKASWDKLLPTVRAAGAEVLVTFNPELETDDTYQRFIVNPPSTAVVIKINWRDNPFFSEIDESLRQDMRDLKERNYDEYLHIYEGHPVQFLEGAIYANELRSAQEHGRITKVPYVPESPVHTFWDLGWADLTSIWFVQKVGMQFNVIDFWQGRKTTVETIFREAIRIPERPYLMGRYYLPHDAEPSNLAAGGTSVKQLVMAACGDSNLVTVLPRTNSVANDINATRTIFPRCWFDEDKTRDGVQALRRYRYDIDPDTRQFSRMPLHDENSHAADAFRYFAISVNSIGATGPVISDYTGPGSRTPQDDGVVTLNGPKPNRSGWMGM